MFFDDFSFIDNLSLKDLDHENINESGYIYGTVFSNIYKPYKNYSVYSINPSNEEERLKLKIMEEAFIVNDLNLYLDLNPDNEYVYSVFKKHYELLNSYKHDYQNKYGSICLNSQKNSYDWLNGKWPWEGFNNV